jgi:hypothetical protein
VFADAQFGHGKEMIGCIELILFTLNGCMVQLDKCSLSCL